MSMYYNLTVLKFKDACSVLLQKTEYISECLTTLESCCRSAITEKISHFDTCENDTTYLCNSYSKPLNSEDSSIVFLFGILGGATFWLLMSLGKVCYNCYCKKKDEYSLEDLDDEEYP